MNQETAPPFPEFGVSAKPQKLELEPDAPKAPLFGPPPTEYEKDWGAAPWSEVQEGFKKEFLPSVGRGIMAIPEAVLNPGQTIEAFKQIGKGIGSKVSDTFSDERKTPEQKATDEAALNAVIEPFTSMAGFKKALATDPYAVTSVFAIPVSGGASALGAASKAAGATTAAGKVLRGAEVAGKLTAGAMDPLYGAGKAAGKAYDYAGKPIAKETVSDVSGVSKPALDLAYEAGKTTDQSLKDAFNTFSKGEGRAEDFSQAVSQASKQMRAAEIGEWAKDKANVLALKQPVPSQPILDAIQEARTIAGPRNLAIGPAAQAHAKLDQLEALLQSRFRLPANNPARTLESFDLLKRELYELGERHPSDIVGNAIKKVNSGVRDAMGAVSPDYVRLMEKYQLLNDKMNTIKKTLATGDNVSAVRELNTFIRGLDNVEKGRFIDELSKYDPRIPYMISGATINQVAGHPSNWNKVISYGTLGNVGWGLATGNPLHWIPAAGVYGASKLIGTPSGAGSTAYGLGTIDRYASKVPTIVKEAAEAEARMAPSQLSRTQNEELMETIRPPRKSGGRVTAEGLVVAAERAKKAVNKTTEPLLEKDDTSVARALEVANKHIEG